MTVIGNINDLYTSNNNIPFIPASVHLTDCLVIILIDLITAATRGSFC